MNFFDVLYSAIYGIIQGISEWLPISSTGHLLLAENIIPFGGDLCGVTTQGLDYPLENEDLIFGQSRGVSNIMTSQKATITAESGFGLIIKARD